METTQTESRPKRGLSRRDFLRLAGASAAGGWVALRHWINENGPAALLSGVLLKKVEEDIPAEFLNEKQDPNPFFENPEHLLEKSFQQYNRWRSDNPNKYPQLVFSKRKNYISATDVMKRYKELENGDTDNVTSEDIVLKTLTRALKSLTPTKTGGEFGQISGGETMIFSAFSIDGINDLLAKDPGSGFIARAIKKTLGVDRETFYRTHNGFSHEESEQISVAMVSELSDALNHFKNKRKESDGPLDLAHGLAYFYSLNEGDLYAGLWDSVVFFKLLVRNDLETLNLNPTFDRSVLLGELFKDPFSPRNSLNWLGKKYIEKGIGASHALSEVGGSNLFKDFMIINRSGGIYHGLNIMTWASVCADPVIVQASIPVYYSGEPSGNDFVTEHGKLKIEADLIVAEKAPEIRQVVDRYVKVR